MFKTCLDPKLARLFCRMPGSVIDTYEITCEICIRSMTMYLCDAKHFPYTLTTSNVIFFVNYRMNQWSHLLKWTDLHFSEPRPELKLDSLTFVATTLL